MTNLQQTTATITNNPAKNNCILATTRTITTATTNNRIHIYFKQQQKTYILIINTRAKNIQKTQPKIMFIIINRTKNSRSFHLVNIISVFR